MLGHQNIALGKHGGKWWGGRSQHYRTPLALSTNFGYRWSRRRREKRRMTWWTLPILLSCIRLLSLRALSHLLGRNLRLLSFSDCSLLLPTPITEDLAAYVSYYHFIKRRNTQDSGKCIVLTGQNIYRNTAGLKQKLISWRQCMIYLLVQPSK